MTSAIDFQAGSKTELYASMSEETAFFVKEAAKTIKARTKTLMEQIVLNGNDLLIIKDKLNHGQFTTWLGLEFQWSEDTAQGFMRVAKEAKINPTVFKLQPSVAYEYCRKNFPEAAKQEIDKRVEAGEPVTVKDIKEIKSKTKAEAEPKPEKLPPKLKKGDIVEWDDMPLKNHYFGRIKSIATDGLTVKLVSLSGMPLGEKLKKFVTLCPIQKLPEFNTFHNNLDHGDFVKLNPFRNCHQQLKGQTLKVSWNDPKKCAAMVILPQGGIAEFKWEELEKVEAIDNANTVIEVEAVAVEVEPPPKSLVSSILPLISKLSDTEIDLLMQELLEEKSKRKALVAA